MKRNNVFMESDLANKKIAEVLGFELSDSNRLYMLTKDIYFQSFFYLTKRFGNCVIYDDYKDAGVWEFSVKQYRIQIYLNSSWTSFNIYGDKSWRMLLSPYWTKYNREYLKKKDRLLNINNPNKAEWTALEKPIAEKLYIEFINQNQIDESSISKEEWIDKYGLEWYEYMEEYNNEIIGLNYGEYNEKYGTIYQNSYTRHALRTLEQFLKNMLTPIYIRDVPYNIKGRISYKEACFYRRYADNIRIESINETPSSSNLT